MRFAETKVCKGCNQAFPREAFGKSGKSIKSMCKECFRKSTNQKRAALRPWKDPNPTQKVCKGCKASLPIESFHTQCHELKDGTKKKYFYPYCKPCQAKNTSAYLKTDRGRELIRARNLRNSFGITIEQYDAMLASQNGVCAICGLAEKDIALNGKDVRRLNVDHCHADGGKIRGLLCTSCNTSIGKMNDDSALLRKAADYIDSHK